MPIVKIKCNPYRNILDVLIDEKPVSQFGKLKHYLAMPFLSWCTESLSLIAQEVNDAFEIEYFGSQPEYEILSYYARRSAVCQGISYKPLPPMYQDNAAQRLKKLNRMIANGVVHSPRRRKIFLDLYGAGDCVDLIKPISTSFCIIQKRILSLEALSGIDILHVNLVFVQSIAIAKDLLSKLSDYSGCVFWLALDDLEGFSGCIGENYMFHAGKDHINECCAQIFELCCYPKLLRECLFEIDKLSTNINSDEYTSLRQIDKEIQVKLPDVIEVGKRYIIEVIAGSSEDRPRLDFRHTGSEIITFDGEEIYANDIGVVHVEVYDENTGRLITENDISCIYVKRIDTLSMFPAHVVMRVGEKVEYTLTYEPENAGNANNITISSDNPLIAYEKDHRIVARGAGICTIRAICEGIKASCSVEVHPLMTNFLISPSAMILNIGQAMMFEIIQEPDSSLPEKFYATTYPSGIVECDIRGRMIQGNSAGRARIDLTDESGHFRQSIFVTVNGYGESCDMRSTRGSSAIKQNSILTKIFKGRK